MVPKKAFCFWGNNKMSWLRYMTIKSFQKMNPDWEVTIYHSPCLNYKKSWLEHNEQDFFKYLGENHFNKINIPIKEWNKCNNMGPSHKSNLFKWDMLATEGGIYFDMDILWVRSIDDFYDKIRNFDVGICFVDWFSIGLLTSSGNNKFYSELYKTALENYTPKKYQCVGVESIYRLLNKVSNNKSNFNILERKYKDLRFYNIKKNSIYPEWYKDIEYYYTRNLFMKDLPEETIGLHWYAGHPVSQKWNNILNHNNYRDHNLTLTNMIKELALDE